MQGDIQGTIFAARRYPTGGILDSPPKAPSVARPQGMFLSGKPLGLSARFGAISCCVENVDEDQKSLQTQRLHARRVGDLREHLGGAEDYLLYEVALKRSKRSDSNATRRQGCL